MLWLTDKTFLNQPVKNDMRTFNNIRKIIISQGYE